MSVVTIPNFVKISQSVAEILQFFFILKVVAVRHLGFVWSIFGLPTVIFNTEQNLIVIDAVFLII